MGGEPTFVSIDDMDGAEWNIAAMGPNKRKLAERLIDQLRDRFAPGGLLHFGQGKWYPGEPLPRWALTCYWRADGIPLWHDRELLAREGDRTDYGPLDAQRFAETLAVRLGVDPEYVGEAFEDPLYYLQRERMLPVNVDPAENKLEDPQERERLRRVFERGLNQPTGMILPIERGWGKNGAAVADRLVDAARAKGGSGSGRFASGVAIAVGEPALGGSGRGAADCGSGPDGESRAAAAAQACADTGGAGAASAEVFEN